MLKFNGEVEAEELMESIIDGASCSEPTTSSLTTLIAVLAVILGTFIDMERPAVPEGSWRARQSRDNRCGCAGIVSRSGSQALGATVGCTCSRSAVLPACVLCLCARSVCLCAGFWRWEQRIACKEPRSVCDLQTLRRGLSSHRKRHCSGP